MDKILYKREEGNNVLQLTKYLADHPFIRSDRFGEGKACLSC